MEITTVVYGVLLLLLVSLSTGQSQNTPTYFPLILGSKYRYYESNCPPQPSNPSIFAGDMVVRDTFRIDGKKYFYLPGLHWGQDTVATDSSGNLVYHYQGKDELFYKFSANVGDTWELTLPFRDYQPRKFVATMRSRTDSIRVPAGIFANCLQIRFQAPGTSAEFTHWLAPNVGLAIRCTQISNVLVEAQIGGIKYPITSVEGSQAPIRNFELRQNYPNPFNPETVIEYEILSRGKTSLRVFDLTGKEVITLLAGIVFPGSYKIKWDARSANGNLVTSGTYIYQLTHNNYQFSRKLLIIR